MHLALHIIEQLSDFGGTPRKLLYLAEHRTGDVRHVFVTLQESNLQPHFEAAGTKAINIGTTKFVPGATRLAGIVSKERPQVICTHFTRSLVLGWPISRLLNIPIIHNEHSSANYRKGLGDIAAKIIVPRVDAIVANSQHTASSLFGAYKIRPEQLSTIYNPVKPRNSANTTLIGNVRSQLGVSTDALVLGHVGGMIPARDQATLVQAFAELNRVRKNSHLLLVGDGPERANLEAQVDSLNLSHSVHFLGYRDDIGTLLRAVDIFINPCIDEGFGIAVVEAMLTGLPVVAARAGAHPELIEDGRTGILFTPGDSADLAARLLRIAADREFGSHLGRSAQKSANERFNPDLYATHYNARVKEVILAHAKRK